MFLFYEQAMHKRWLGGVVVRALDSWSRGRGFDSDRGIIRATTLGNLFTPNVPLFTKQCNLVPFEGLHAKSAVLLAAATVQWTRGYCRAVLWWSSDCIEPRYKSSALPLMTFSSVLSELRLWSRHHLMMFWVNVSPLDFVEIFQNTEPNEDKSIDRIIGLVHYQYSFFPPLIWTSPSTCTVYVHH